MYLWMEGKRESIPQRFKEIASSSPAKARWGILDGNMGKWLEGIRNRFARKHPRKDEIVELLTAKELVGARLLLNHAGYRKPISYSIYWAARFGFPILLVGLDQLGHFAPPQPRYIGEGDGRLRFGARGRGFG